MKIQDTTQRFDLSIIIPARGEEFVQFTVESIVKARQAKTEVIVVLDGYWPNRPIEDYDDVNIIHLPNAVGQRKATNIGAATAMGEYFMKLDSHCWVEKGFDAVLLEHITPEMVVVPVMKNLHAFDHVCNSCGHRQDQGPTWPKCPKCGSKDFYQDIMWEPRPSPNSMTYRFSPQLEFDYFGQLKQRPEFKHGVFIETMSLQGSCFVAHKSLYWGLKLCDDALGRGKQGWGGQGAEVAVKAQTAGYPVYCDTSTSYGHLFRTQGGDFSFQYPNPGDEQQATKQQLRDIFLHDIWEHQKVSLAEIVDHFMPVPDWHDMKTGELLPNAKAVLDNIPKIPAEPKPKNEWTKGILYYTDNRIDDKIAIPVIKQLRSMGMPTRYVSLKPIGFINPDPFNIVIMREPGYMTMFEQILRGLLELKGIGIETVFFAEHDVLYHPSHFEFTPQRDDTFYYNTNVWKVHATYGFGLHYDCNQTSGLCANIDLLIDHYQRRIAYLNDNKPESETEFRKLILRVGFEPGTHGRIPELSARSESWKSPHPNIDIRHKENLTPSRWWKHQFRNQKYTEGWTTTERESGINGWGKMMLRFDDFLEEVANGQHNG